MKETPYTDAFLHKLKEDMNGLKLKQIDLAGHLNKSKQYVSHWFCARRKPNGETILKIQGWIKSKTLFFL